MLVTVVIPVHNGQDTIEAAVWSAIEAGADKVMVFDDASTDQTDVILEKTRQKWPRMIETFYISNARSGVNFARNYLIDGIEETDGLVIPLDADDLLLQIQPLVDAYDEGFWVYGDHREYDAVNEQTTIHRGSPAATLNRKNITGVTFLFSRKDWLKVGGYDPDFPFCEDFAFQCALTDAGIKPRYVDAVIYQRNLRPKGNERTAKAGAYWKFFHEMAMEKFPSIFSQTR